ncbi:MAG: hypothetical protein ACE15B_09580 [Bryobacteraceae bacterium]
MIRIALALASALAFEHVVIDPAGPLDISLKTVGDLDGDHRPDEDGDGLPGLFGADWRGRRAVDLWKNVKARGAR